MSLIKNENKITVIITLRHRLFLINVAFLLQTHEISVHKTRDF